jgi:hypothetical protein
MWRDIIYLKKGSCVNVPTFTGDGVVYEKSIKIPIINKTAGGTLTFKKDGTFVIDGQYGDNKATYTNNKWVYMKDDCVLGITLDPEVIKQINTVPVVIDNSLQYNSKKQLTIKLTIDNILSLDVVISPKK